MRGAERYRSMRATVLILLATGFAIWMASFVKPIAVRLVLPNSKGVGRVGTDPGQIREPGGRLTFLPAPGNEIASFSAGCFWGVENTFRHLPGVTATAVGYTGGSTKFPTYEQSHAAGHAETVLVEFNPRVVTYGKLLDTFWTFRYPSGEASAKGSRNPYRSTVWTFGEAQMNAAMRSRDDIEKKGHRRVLTNILPAKPFYLAEEYHQQYDEKTGTEACPLPTP